MTCNQLEIMNETHYTLIFVKRFNKILLGFKKRGLGKSTWNGYGGKLQEDEDVLDCAVRELKEESYLNVDKEKLHYLGVVVYDDNCDKTNHRRIVYIFSTNEVDGLPKETEEMIPEWFDFQEIPYKNMWPDSKYWLPLVLEDRWLFARFTYKNNFDVIVEDVRELQKKPSLNDEIKDYSSIDSSLEKYRYKKREVRVQNM